MSITSYECLRIASVHVDVSPWVRLCESVGRMTLLCAYGALGVLGVLGMLDVLGVISVCLVCAWCALGVRLVRALGLSECLLCKNCAV